MPTLTPYLSFDGNCAEAMKYYERVIGGELKSLLKNSQIPGACEHLPPGNEDRIMHAYLGGNGFELMAGDAVVGWPIEPMKGFHLTVTYTDVDDARRVFDALADGGKVTMPFEKTFYAEASGMLVDRYGTPWIVNGPLVPMQQ